MALEDLFDRLEIEFRGQVHHRQIFVIKGVMRGRRVAVAAHQIVELVQMRVHVAVEVHRHEARQLQEARIDPAQEPHIGPGHGHNDVLLEPGEVALLGQTVRLGGVDGGIDRAAHKDQRCGPCGVFVLGHQAGRGQAGHARLADRHDRDALAAIGEELDKLADIAGVVRQIEAALRQGNVTGIDPVGHVDLVLGQHRLDRAANERREMAGHRCDDQDFGIVSRAGGSWPAFEVDQVAKRLGQQHFFGYRDHLVRDFDLVDVEFGLAVAFGGIDEHVAGRRGRACRKAGGEREKRIPQRITADAGGGAHGPHCRMRQLISVIQHDFSPVVFPVLRHFPRCKFSDRSTTPQRFFRRCTI